MTDDSCARGQFHCCAESFSQFTCSVIFCFQICASFIILSVVMTSVDMQRCEGNEKPWKVVPADVGGRVHLHCEVHGLCKYLYWQRGLTEGNAEETFVNGFSTEEELTIPDEFKNRSRVNETTRSLDLWNLKPSDLAYYACICIKQGQNASSYCLNVTASFSKPSLTSQLRDDGLVEVTCGSGGGYPLRRIRWQESIGLNGSRDWEATNQSEWQDPVSELWDVDSTIVMNCTQPLKVSCSVGNTTSDYLEICRPSLLLLLPFPPHVLIAIGVVALLVLGIVVFGVVKLLKRCRRPSRRQADGPLQSFQVQKRR
ncbi:uncharacterized protein LOC134454463 isoform X2 [Engraulis encrasicolus]|uniref:uncharacterized protein LOC134454463 isoform X2 n=1 Tax=Engraulis encrasicolus TaxID=184585 RepID=UPI002FD65E4A